MQNQRFKKITSVDLIFDLGKLKTSSNPCIFYKQLNFGYDFTGYKTVQLGERKLYFSHTSYYIRQRSKRLSHSSDSDVVFCISEAGTGGYEYYSSSPKPYFISYNVPDIEQILTLNFFRFIDNLHNKHEKEVIALLTT